MAASTLLPRSHTRTGASVANILVPRAGRWIDPDMQALAARAVDAARAAGASYADARLTILRQQRFDATRITTDSETFGVGVRVLVNGFWGFQSSAVRTPDEMVRLARGAVGQAKASSRGTTREIRWDPIPVVKNESWIMPVKYDPFDIPVGERADFAGDVSSYMNGLMDANPMATYVSMQFRREYKVFASSEGSSWTQTTYRTSAQFAVYYRDEYHAGLPAAGAGADFLSAAGRGWEYITESGLAAAIPQLIEDAEQARHRVPVDIGRHDMVLSAEAMATLVDQTLGAATELDRALGYEANATGTSYLDRPETMLGTQVVASPQVQITANRSLPGGVATVQWDDEGVVPEPFTLVSKGLLVDYQTTREQAAWLAPYYQRAGLPVRSHGCAAASTALDLTMQQAPNLALMPGSGTATFESLVAGVEKGIALLDLSVSMDQQQLNGIGSGTMREIVHGKLGRFINGGALVFRAPELWKSVSALGGVGTQRWYGRARGKGEPGQQMDYSVGAVPAAIPQLSLIDATRKA